MENNTSLGKVSSSLKEFIKNQYLQGFISLFNFGTENETTEEVPS